MLPMILMLAAWWAAAAATGVTGSSYLGVSTGAAAIGAWIHTAPDPVNDVGCPVNDQTACRTD